MSELVHYQAQSEVAVLTIDHPPVNSLSTAVADALESAVQQAAADPAVSSIVIHGAGPTFTAGADIKEFPQIVSGERPRLDLSGFLATIENSPKPVVMALHGTTLGGGLETAMAGHYRLIAPGSVVGQPEVKLGIIPGAGGTQRLPRLAGVPTALELCVTGEPITAEQAVAAGIVDRLIEGDFLSGAILFARSIAHQPIPITRNLSQKLKNVNPEIFAQARARVRLRAPLAAIDAIEAATKLPFEQGLKREAELFNECLFSSESKALIHIFFAERAAAKIPGIPVHVKPLPIASAAVIGAGTMGAGIAMTYANSGIPVRLKDTTREALDRGLETIRKNYQSSVAKGRLSSEMAAQRLALITPQLTYDAFDQADIITEAVFESMPLKKQIFAELDSIAKAACLLATNTSSLNIDEIASATRRPESVIGTHFFSPAHVMKLLEVVRGQATSHQSIVTAMALGKRFGKVAVLSGNCYGFIGNRMIDKYLREAYSLLEEGASVEQINQALVDFGMAMGPLAMDDLAGLDVGYLIRQAAPTHGEATLPDRLYALGRYGQKTNRGWSLYDAQRKPSPDPEVAALIEQTAREHGIQRRAVSNQEIVDRCIGALIAEGRHILDEGIALRSSDIDVVYVRGYGFPAWRGGPMHFAENKA